MIDTVGSLGYGKKLGKYGFSERLCSNKEQCEKWLNFCKKNNMVWLDGSYGTLVHKKFNKYFERIPSGETHDILVSLGISSDDYSRKYPLNHSNVIQSKINGAFFVTSSPNYLISESSKLKEYPYHIYLIDTRLLEDYMLDDYSIAYSNASWEEWGEINNIIYDDLGIYRVFRRYK